MFKRIDHVEIVPSNLERSLEFYIEILGFKVKQRMKIERPPLKEIVFIELNDSVIEFISVDNPAPVSRERWQVCYLRMALEVEDIDKAMEYLQAKGVEIAVEPVALRGSKRAEIKDPDGLSIELRQWG